MASNLGYTLGNFALQNNPTMIGRQKRMGLGSMFGFDGSKDPNKSVIAQQAPSALSNPEANISDIIGGAIAKSPMSLAASQARDPSVDTSSLGNFGEVNSSAGTDVTGAQPKTTKGNFWDSKGGGILQSLLGVLALGGLGAGIGAISGGGRGALQGASYGMGFGALQDLALRKSAMEGAANEEKLDFERAKAAEAAKSDLQKDVEYIKTLPEYSNMSMQDIAKTAYNLQKPYSEEDRLFKQQQAEAMNQMRADSLALKKAALEKEASEDLEKNVQRYTKEVAPIKSLISQYQNLSKNLGFDLSTYDKEKGTAVVLDPKTNQPKLDASGNIIREKVNPPGVTVPLLGSRIPGVPGTKGFSKSKDIQGQIETIKTIKVHELFGASQTSNEMAAIQRMFQNNAFGTESDMIAAMKRFYELASEDLKLRDTASPKVRQTWQERYEASPGASAIPPAVKQPQADDYRNRLLKRKAELEAQIK